MKKEKLFLINNLITKIPNNRPVEEILMNLSKILENVIKGDFYYIQSYEKTFLFFDKYGNEVEDITMFLDSETFREIRKEKKRYLSQDENDFFLGIPIIHKNKFLGGVLVKEKQLIKDNLDIEFATNYLVLLYKYNSLNKIEKMHTIKDFVTDLYNKRHFQFQLEIEYEKKKIYPKQFDLTLIIIEMKNFYELVKKYDYNTAEQAFVFLAEIVKRQSRKEDMPARIDENKIGILLPYTKEIGGEKLSTRVINSLRKKVDIENKKIDINIKCVYGMLGEKETKDEFLSRVKHEL